MTAAFTGHIPRPSHLLLHHKPLTIAISVAAGILGLVAAIHPAWLLEVDRPISEAFRGEALVGFFRFWSRLGSQQDMIVGGLALSVLLWPMCRPFAVGVPSALVVGAAFDVTLKVIVDRPRPPDALVGTALGSFPSGHAITGVIFFGLLPPAVWIALRRRLVFWISVPLAVVAGLLVVLSRVYLGAHWPSDVVASMFIGASVLLLTEYVLSTDAARKHCDGCPLHRSRAEARAHDERAVRTS